MTSIAAQVRTLGRGPSRARNLEREEARDALAAILAGDAAPEAVGALFMLMRYRGESAAEIAGFVDALRGRALAWAGLGAAVDWPSYAAGRTRGLPLYLLAARLVSASGRQVLIHGWNSHLTHPVGTAIGAEALGLPVARDPGAARDALEGAGIVYVPLDALDEEALRLLRLREVLGLRSPLNTALRAWNPAGAPVTVQGVFHPSYRALQTEAAELLGQEAVAVVKGGGGEFERHPGKAVELWGYRGQPFDMVLPADPAWSGRRLKPDEGEISAQALTGLWSGARPDPFAEAVVIATAGAALFAAGAAPDLNEAEAEAARLWKERPR